MIKGDDDGKDNISSRWCCVYENDIEKYSWKNDYVVIGEAENGQAAIEKYQELKPDLVIMDITMPEMSGVTALKEIKSIDANARVIMCSAMGQQTMVVDAIQAGARDFIVKPFQPDRVIEAVKRSFI